MKKNKCNILHDLCLTVFALAAATAIGLIFGKLDFHETNIVLLYLFSVLLTARFTKGYFYGIIASAVSILLFNWFFTEPYFTLKVHDPTYIITFFIMMLTSVLTSALTTKVKLAAEEAIKREKESNALFQMTNHLTDAEDPDAVSRIIANAVGDILGCRTAFICFDENGNPGKNYVQRRDDRTLIHRELEDGEELKRRMENLHSGADITEDSCLYPVYGKTDILAVLRIPKEVSAAMTDSQTRMLHSVIESCSLALERLRSLEEQARSREETTQERYRSNLLRAISHDIRTPLSGIMGTGEMIISTTEKSDPRYARVEDILKDARWLHDMVENILNLTKLRDGKMVISKEPEAVEEVVGAVLAIMEKRLPDRNIELEMPENVVMAPMDARLVSQVLINLIDNAEKHTPKDKEISLSVKTDENDIRITVSDRGSGIAESDLPHIFEMFYTTGYKNPDSKRGVGLGLAICRSIVEAHGGKIIAKNRKGGGAEFTFTLPMGGNQS